GRVRTPIRESHQGAVWMSVVIVVVLVALVEPALVLALQLVVEDDALDVRGALQEARLGLFVGAIDLEVVFQFTLPSEARVERLMIVPIEIPMSLENAAAVRGRDRVRATVRHRYRGRACGSQVGSSRHHDRDRWSRCGLHGLASESAARHLANRSHEDRNPWPYHPSDLNWKRDGRRLQVRI